MDSNQLMFVFNKCFFCTQSFDYFTPENEYFLQQQSVIDPHVSMPFIESQVCIREFCLQTQRFASVELADSCTRFDPDRVQHVRN